MAKITKKACEGLSSKLDLPVPDIFSQDWEIEIASSNIAEKVLDSYIYRKDLNKDERFTLMNIVIESINDYIYQYNSKFPKMDILKNILCSEFNIYKEVIIYYACLDINIEDSFPISKFMREILLLCNDK